MEMRSLIYLLLVIFAAITVIWVACGGLCEVCKINGKNMESLDAWFSGLAFAGMIAAIVLQSKELALQRQELVDTRAELKRTAEANERSAKLAKENIEAQEKIAKNTIAAQRLSLIIDYYYKQVEFSRGSCHSEFTEKRGDIEKVLNKFLELKGPNGPIIDDQTIRFSDQSSTPEA